ncbi:MAG TPA: DUF3488 and transglutaminase-like domain-containing protein [Methylotenera sp.]|nr:DUF3488 and transglutaminase-like domain-containing protein [Methylotenera sp.]HPH05246.1 DUF3488 and transglutaminase-like domain-containing protein [Methylotenera sp.]HPN00148.1 DUF3488 and transglutaminase-like domain-containing protein [Methylotenera sp.]
MMNEPSKAQYRWLLFTLAFILVLHSLNLPIWVVIISIIFGTWRYLVLRNNWAMPKILILAPITIFIGIGILLTFKGQFGRETSLAMLISMLSLKLLEAKTKRDYILVVVLGYFIVGNLFLFNQSVFTFLVSIVPLLLLTAALIQLNLQIQAPALSVLKLSGKMLLQAVPLMLILFVLFPRIPGPLWSLPQYAHGGIGLPGLSDSIKFNQVSQNAMDDSVAFRVKFKGKIPPQNQLYWRGPVLWISTNDEWNISNQNGLIAQEPLTTAGEALEYSITLEPHKQKWLLMLDMPSRIPDFATFTHDYSVVSKEPIYARIRYDATSYAQYRLGAARLSKREKNFSLQLNDGENPRTLALGQQWRDLNAQDTVNAALTLFREKDFYYTLNPPILGKNPIDDFLFNSKRGFCEHYAISFVTLMRAAGLPARVVTGYQGGELNPNDNFLIIRQMDAHAWAEVWLKDRGWVRVDPTAAVSPARVERGLVEAARAARPAPGQTKPETSNLPITTRSKQIPIIHQAMLRWDSIDNGWNQWVIGYNQIKQQSFLSSIAGKKVTTQTMLIWLICATMLLGISTLLVIYQKNQAKLNRAQKFYAQFVRKCRKVDLQPQPFEGALNFAQRAARALPHQRDELMAIAEAYNQLQYSKYSEIEDNTLITDLEKRIKNFNPRA